MKHCGTRVETTRASEARSWRRERRWAMKVEGDRRGRLGRCPTMEMTQGGRGQYGWGQIQGKRRLGGFSHWLSFLWHACSETKPMLMGRGSERMIWSSTGQSMIVHTWTSRGDILSFFARSLRRGAFGFLSVTKTPSKMSS